MHHEQLTEYQNILAPVLFSVLVHLPTCTSLKTHSPLRQMTSSELICIQPVLAGVGKIYKICGQNMVFFCSFLDMTQGGRADLREHSHKQNMYYTFNWHVLFVLQICFGKSACRCLRPGQSPFKISQFKQSDTGMIRKWLWLRRQYQRIVEHRHEIRQFKQFFLHSLNNLHWTIPHTSGKLISQI